MKISLILLLFLLFPHLSPRDEYPILGDFSQSGITVYWIDCGDGRNDPASYTLSSSDGSYTTTIDLTFIIEVYLQCAWTAPIPILPHPGQYTLSNGHIGDYPINLVQYGPTNTTFLQTYRLWLQRIIK